MYVIEEKLYFWMKSEMSITIVNGCENLPKKLKMLKNIKNVNIYVFVI